ncbi:hypothetical protein HU200_042144 [Digitaria exilis]|uniref:CRM-domain containing factor CFM3, chloroplastic/mitochondrial n=1 Tax=Digitaria exilis TaxID=1010633 RepID=A0A835BGL6_9POAL|nr:hypothetical protein HU200_042144 [Digitaria exilis]
MALLSPPPFLSPKPPFPSSLRSAHSPRVRCSRITTATASVSSPTPASASSPSTSSPAASDGAVGGKKKKKRRPLKPSFEDQALRRWSVRAPTQRASVPWEESQQQSPPPPHLAGRESGSAGSQRNSGGGSSATLRSIVDYFSGGSSIDDGDEDVREEEGAGNDSTALRDVAPRDKDDVSHFRPSYLVGNMPVSAPWMHGEESSNDQGLSSSVDEGEKGVDMDDISDDELGLMEGDDEELDSGKDLLDGSSEEELYDDYAVPTVNSSYGVDLAVGSGSKRGGFDSSMRRGSVSSIVNTLRSSMAETNPNIAIERSNAEDFVQKMGSVLLPWEREEEEDDDAFDVGKTGRRSNTELAERTIPEHELRRLRDAALRMQERIKVGPAGVTQDIVESIHKKWQVYEVLKMRFEGPPSLNMKRTHDLLEDRTGGIVIWRSGRSVVLYRGMNYNLRCVQSYAESAEVDSDKEVADGNSAVLIFGSHTLQKSRVNGVKHSTSGGNFSLELEANEAFDIDSFLDQLGPRYKDWSDRGPSPVDADFLKLTGGVLLSRNKEYIVFYRGNDFITPKVRQVLVEKQEQAITRQDEEELARLKASASITTIPNESRGPLVAGTLAETTEAKSRWGDSLNDKQKEEEMKHLALKKHASILRNLKRKMILARTKVAKAERALAKVQEFLSPAELPTDLETVTDEERFLFRRIGLKMRAFLMLGRREVFDGTVQNMHLHWKHRELVKIIVRGKSFAQVKHIAISLEAESEGVLISLDKTTKGYAIIFYRGKNYRRPQILKPRNLLTRRQALARSIELQRREVQMKAAKENEDVKLLQTVEDNLLSDDDDVEVRQEQ